MKKLVISSYLFLMVFGCLSVLWAQSTNPIMIGQSQLEPGGYLHYRYNYTKEGDTNVDNPDTLDILRARLFLDGRITPDVTGRIEYDLRSSTLLDLYVKISHLPYTDWLVTVGQFKTPFSFAGEILGTPLQETVKGPLIYEPLTPTPMSTFSDREIGIMAKGEMLNKKAEYTLGIFNGNGINTTDDNDIKDRLIQFRMLPWKDDARSPLKPMMIGASWLLGEVTEYDVVSGTMVSRGINTRERYSYTLRYEIEKTMVTYEYFRQTLDVDGTENINSKAWYVQLSRDEKVDLFNKKQSVRPVFRYEFYDPDNTQDNNEVRMTTYGFNWQINRALRLQVNYNNVSDDLDTRENETLIQLEIKF